MTTFRRILTIASLLSVLGFAQETAAPQAAPTDSTTDKAAETPASVTDSIATVDSTADSTASLAKDSTAVPADSAKTVAAVDSTKADTLQADTSDAEPAWVKPRNKITYAQYQAKINASAKKKSRTLHHGLTIVSANYHDESYGDLDHGADWGTGLGMYYFYRRYFGHYVGFQGRLGGLYRYSRFEFDKKWTNGSFKDGTEYSLEHNFDRKYHNFAVDLPLTLKLGHHVKKTTGFIFMSATLDITKPIFEMVDTENYLYLNSNSKEFNAEMETITNEGKNPFPLYESHQTNKFFYMDDWETSGWLGFGVESRLVSFEVQFFGIGTSTKDNHRYYHLGHDSDMTWRIFLDFSIR